MRGIFFYKRDFLDKKQAGIKQYQKVNSAFASYTLYYYYTVSLITEISWYSILPIGRRNGSYDRYDSSHIFLWLLYECQ